MNEVTEGKKEKEGETSETSSNRQSINRQKQEYFGDETKTSEEQRESVNF